MENDLKSIFKASPQIAYSMTLITREVLYILWGPCSPQNQVFFILALLRSKDQDGNFTAVTSSSSSSIGDLFTYILYDFPFNEISNKTTSICKVSF